MKILGIDPGSTRIGYGIIEDATATAGQAGGLKLLDYGVLEIKEKNLPDRLNALSLLFDALLKKHRPDMAGIEKIFFAKNTKTAIDVSHSRGVLLAGMRENQIPILEFTPNEVKLAVSGYGLSDKKAVAKMVMRILNLKELKGYDDASDAIAVALTTAFNKKLAGLA